MKELKEEKEERNPRIKKLAIKRRGGIYQGKGGAKNEESIETIIKAIPSKISSHLSSLAKIAFQNISEALNSKNEKIKVDISKWIVEFIYKTSEKRITRSVQRKEKDIKIVFADEEPEPEIAKIEELEAPEEETEEQEEVKELDETL